MKKVFKTLAGLLMLGVLSLSIVNAQNQTGGDQETAAWKRLGKIRIRSGIWLSKVGTFRWGFHMKEIREALETAAFDQEVMIVMVLDGGMRVNLGTYRPRIQEAEVPAISWPAVPNLREMDIDVRVTTGEMYRILFLDTEGKEKASILTRVILI